jgi:hypothetical protein
LKRSERRSTVISCASPFQYQCGKIPTIMISVT